LIGTLIFTVVLLIGVVYIGWNLSKDLTALQGGSALPYILLCIALFVALGFEFVNGFHDTANAVATVIYTHSMEPHMAVTWSGFCNFAGVVTSTGAVAFGIVSLLPVELILQVGSGAGFVTVFALLAAAILWNLGTWYFEVTQYIRTKEFTPSTMLAMRTLVNDIGNEMALFKELSNVPNTQVRNFRNDMFLASEALRLMQKSGKPALAAADTAVLKNYKSHVDKATRFIPLWVKVAVALALGLGTMVGWKRIVVTVGEKIGKNHLTYAQGAAAEITAMATIGAADAFGLPVSTTHVLSSGVAGTMTANRSGLQMSTVKNLLLAWVLTLPAAMMLSGFLFWTFRKIFWPEQFAKGRPRHYFCRLPVSQVRIPFFLFAFPVGYGILSESILEDTSMRQLKHTCRLEALPRRMYRGSGWTMSAHAAVPF